MKLNYQDDFEVQINANKVKELLLTQLERDGVPINSKELSEKYAVVVYRKGYFGTLIDKIFGFKDEENLYMAVVKILPIVRKII